ncbi:MAG: FKBP-type peptidyl-prolyl cis-trans isomerase [Gemmatimonadota bacterium]
MNPLNRSNRSLGRVVPGPSRMNLQAGITALALTVGSVACGDAPAARSGLEEGTASMPAVDLTEVSYASELTIDLTAMERTGSGLYFRDDVVGEGTLLESGQDAVLHYTGYFPDGRSFDSSPGGPPFRIRVGVGRVIRGWDEGLPGMREGGSRTLVIPPELAYGAQGAGGGVIPPNAVLVFQVELLEVH